MAGKEVFEEKMDVDARSGLEAKTDMLRIGNISLILDSYNDIFSDFDPRPVTEKALSDDFLKECKRASFDKHVDSEIELRILVPKKKRKIAEELKIRKRLQMHFSRHYHMSNKELHDIKRDGIGWFLIGGILIMIAVLIQEYEGFLFKFLLVLFEPAGWFTIWTGLEKIFFDVKEKHPEHEFYTKMSKAKIYFLSY
jgi:hypothetical protein